MKKINPIGSKTLYVGGIYEVDKASGGSVTRTVTYYPVAGAMRVDGTLYYMLKDHLGSASVLTNASGNAVSGADVRYYPFGEARSSTGSLLTDKLFTGQPEMAGLGIYHYQARFYSPKLGRFLSPDSIVPSYAIPQSLNRFGYVLNNPLIYIDPTGHAECRTEEECEDMGTTPMGTGNPHNGGGGDDKESETKTEDPVTIILNQLNDLIEQGGGCNDFWGNPACLDYFSNMSQDVATLISLGGALTTSLTTVIGCIGGVGSGVLVGCAAGYKFGSMAHKNIFNKGETIFSFISFVTTISSDIVTQDTSFEPGNFSIGEDAITGTTTFVIGTLVTEPFVDAGVDFYASGYNHGFFSGFSEILSWRP